MRKVFKNKSLNNDYKNLYDKLFIPEKGVTGYGYSIEIDDLEFRCYTSYLYNIEHERDDDFEDLLNMLNLTN